MAYLDILECRDRSFYVGNARDLDVRLAQHQSGQGSKYTARRRPVKLVFCEYFDRIEDAYEREKQVQGWSRAKRVALIEGRYSDLSALSRPKPKDA